jgi:hypothetical protein
MKAKLNVWIRNRKCEVITDATFHLDLYPCCGGGRISRTWVAKPNEGHAELEVPPGCYLVTAGLYPGLAVDGLWGNFYTDWAMVIVRCGDDACVNLILNNFKRTAKDIETTKPKVPVALIQEGCAGRIIIPLVVNAVKAGVRKEDIQKTIAVLAKASDLDIKQVKAAIGVDIEESRKYVKRGKSEEDFLAMVHELL